MPKFSIIVPIYNAEQYLKQCIDSILNQIYQDFELILVDDGSTDNCPVICDEYAIKDNRIKVIHKQNNGVSMARQDAIAIAQGKYLVFVDADDSITKDCLEEIVAHDGVDVIRYGHNVENSNGKVTVSLPFEREGYFSKEDIERKIFPYLIQGVRANYYCPSLWAHAFKRELFIENMLKDKKVTMGEDGACVMPCIYNAHSLYCIKKCLYNYNYNDASATKGGKVIPWNDPITVVTHITEKIDINRFDFKEQIDRIIVHKLFSAVISQFHRKEKYNVIKREILAEMHKSPYKEAIANAKFKKSIKAEFMLFALKYKQIWMIKLYAMIR